MPVRNPPIRIVLLVAGWLYPDPTAVRQHRHRERHQHTRLPACTSARHPDRWSTPHGTGGVRGRNRSGPTCRTYQSANWPDAEYHAHAYSWSAPRAQRSRTRIHRCHPAASGSGVPSDDVCGMSRSWTACVTADRERLTAHSRKLTPGVAYRRERVPAQHDNRWRTFSSSNATA
jgi:hypothetical protein